METIIEGIVEKCIQNELIEESQRDWMTYSLQRKFMNFGGFFMPMKVTPAPALKIVPGSTTLWTTADLV